MESKKITKFLKNPGKMYIKMNSTELEEFFSTGYVSLMKNKCKEAYTITDLRRGILQANHFTINDDHRHIVDLLMFALGKLEDSQQTINDLEQIITFENSNKNETEIKNKDERI